MAKNQAHAPKSAWDHGSDPAFLDYYSAASLSAETLERFATIQRRMIHLIKAQGREPVALQVVDIGCGAGTQCRLWAVQGHVLHGVDINAPLIEVARRRAQEDGLSIQFDVGSATDLPYPDASMDVVLLPELLEHVADWESCLREAVRVMRPGGVLFLSTSNVLCPVQHEFELPLYSWYPRFLKRRYERLSVTTRPELVNHARYPAVNWFSFYGLRSWLRRQGVECYDRFDLADTGSMSRIKRLVISAVRAIPPLRFLGHVAQAGTIVFGVKRS